MKHLTRVYKGYAFSSHSQKHRGEPLLFSISALGYFTCGTLPTHGTNSFMSHPKDEAMVKCLDIKLF